uniref:Putative effector protein n=1 Tax=Heterodera avenae TaxID=34510 RepID=A0A2L0VDI8_HETAV|nr:putative effector protein [Heterodera avenae]
MVHFDSLFKPFIAFCFLCVTSSTKIHSNVVEMNERFLEVKDEGLWFVMFYAPWCAHCKKMMPVWEHMAHALADKNSPVRIGKLDCTRFSSVSSALRISGYPTIIFFRNGVQLHYEGERSKNEMAKFVEKCSGPMVGKIDTSAKFTELRQNSENEPFFVFFDPAQRAEEEKSSESELWHQFEKASEALFTEIRFFELHNRGILSEKMEELAANATKIIAVRDTDYWTIFADEKDALKKWVGQNRWPFLPQVNAANILAIADSTKKLLVLGSVHALDRLNSSTESGKFFDMIKRTSIEARTDDEIERHFQFGWLDGAQIANSVVMDTLPMPNLVVLNYSSYEYYLCEDQPMQMTVDSLLLFLHNVRQGQVVTHGGRAWITRLRRMAYEITSNVYDMFQHQPILTVCLFGVPLAFFSIITYSICSADFSVEREEIYPDEEEDDEDLPLDGLDNSSNSQNLSIDGSKKAD